MRNYTITSIWDIPIRINVSLVVFLPLLAWLIGSGGQITIYAGLIEQYIGVPLDVPTLRAGSTPWVIGIVAAVGLFVSVTLHELGHSWVALRYGLGIDSITLWILGGMAALSSIPREWDREFWIAVAGPITSILTAAVCWAVVLVVPPSLPVLQFIFGWLAIVNLTLAAFNMLPAFPMDGGRVLRALLARSRPYGTATRIAARIGVAFAILFGIVGVLAFSPLLILLAIFVYGAATTESRTVLIDELLEGITVRDVMSGDDSTIPGTATVAEFADRMLQDHRTIYPVTDDTGDIVGVVSLSAMRSVDATGRDSTTVADVARAVPWVEADADAFETLASLGQARTEVALVEASGEFAGLLSESDFAEALTFQREFRSGALA